MSRYRGQNNDLLNNCDNFISKMMKTNKQVETRRPTSRSRDRSINRLNNQIVISRPTAAKTNLQIVKSEEPCKKPSNQELIHKEVFNNNMATVEVTVRTVAPKGPEIKQIEEVREPWGKILNNRKSEEAIGTFGNFDPLRTLHFLSKELQLKLQNLCPTDTYVHQIVHDMQNAMQRLPPDVLTQFKNANPQMFQNSSAGDVEYPTNIKKSSSHMEPQKMSKQIQTVIIGDAETKRMQQQLEESANKLEASCKEMETVCAKLRGERDEFEAKLSIERETVAILKKELEENQSTQEARLSKAIKQLEEERDDLRRQVTNLKSEHELQASQTVDELRTLVEEIRNKYLVTEQENSDKRNELTMMKLERDKMNVLLESRDKQLKELRNELESIQQLVSSQLMELKTKPPLSTATSMSSTSQLWNCPSTRSQKFGNSVHELYLNNGMMRRMLLSKDLKIAESGTVTTENPEDIQKDFKKPILATESQEMPQRDSPSNKIKSQMTISNATISTITENDFTPKMSSASLKDMFAEIKRQAFKKLDVAVSSSSRSNKAAVHESRASLSS